MFGKPVGRTMTFNPLGSVFSTGRSGRTSPEAVSPRGVAFAASVFLAGEAWTAMRARRIRATERNLDIHAPLRRKRGFYPRRTLATLSTASQAPLCRVSGRHSFEARFFRENEAGRGPRLA